MTDFQTAYDKHTAYFFAELFGPASDGPQEFGPGYVTDVCRCGHERGSHWDGDGSCDPATCGCRIFRDQFDRPTPVKLDGCTCGAIGTSGAHRAGCAWQA